MEEQMRQLGEPQSRAEIIGRRQIELLQAILAEFREIKTRMPEPTQLGGITPEAERLITGRE